MKDRGVADDIPATDDRGEVSPMSSPRVSSMTGPIDIETKKIRQEDKQSPLSPLAGQKKKEVAFADTKPPSTSSPLESIMDSYCILEKFQRAAGKKLALGELMPCDSPPRGFSGRLPEPLYRQWHDFLSEYASGRQLKQAELEQHFTSIGKYLDLGKNYWVKDGKLIALRWFCNPVHRNRVYELIDEALSWDVAPKEEVALKPVPKPLTPEEEQAYWKESRDILRQSPLPEQTRSILSRILSRTFPQEVQHSVEMQEVPR